MKSCLIKKRMLRNNKKLYKISHPPSQNSEPILSKKLYRLLKKMILLLNPFIGNLVVIIF